MRRNFGKENDSRIIKSGREILLIKCQKTLSKLSGIFIMHWNDIHVINFINIRKSALYLKNAKFDYIN